MLVYSYGLETLFFFKYQQATSKCDIYCFGPVPIPAMTVLCFFRDSTARTIRALLQAVAAGADQ